jgi:cysteine-rich repeat protein
MRSERRAGLVAVLLALGCQSAPTAVIVEVSADPDVTGVFQLQAILSNAETSDEKLFPATRAEELTFDTAFSLTFDGSRSGTLDVALTGRGSGGALVAYGDGSIDLAHGHTLKLPITLHAGVTTCGDNVVDGDEECDDGNRITDGTCDFRCRNRAGGGGAGGAGGGAGGAGGGAGGGPGASGAGGAAGGPCTVSLLTNGTFEQGMTGWTLMPSDRPLISRADEIATISGISIQPVSPATVAWLAYDLLNSETSVSQSFTIPADALSLIIAGYVQVRTDESGCECDYGYVDLVFDGQPDSLETWSAQDAATGWTYFTDTVSLAGVSSRTAALRLRGVTDDGVNTSFFFDNVSVTAVRCP